jgi:predicted metal-dependent hydrolase
MRFFVYRIKRKRRVVKKRTSKQYVEYKEQARELVKQRLEYFNQFYGFAFHRVAIRNQKTRWGSCSKKGNLNFNYKIALLPVALQDYIVVHELCHLQEMNHSSRFWALVAKTMPNYAQLRRNLKNYHL